MRLSATGQIRRRTQRWNPSQPGKILKQWRNRKCGYCYVTIQYKLRLAHRLICEAFHGKPPSRLHQTAHGDGKSANNRPDNLRWATRRQNYQDQILHGTSKRGRGQANAVLTETKVREIRRLAGAVRTRDLSERFGVGQSAVSSVIARRTWPHVE